MAGITHVCPPISSEPASPTELAAASAERLLDGIIVVLQDFDTETLLRIADHRDAIHPDGWMQRLIREYVDVWRHAE
jgi:hypothetical protein